MRAIITGIAGFIGAHVAQAMIDKGWNVTGIDNLEGGFLSNVPPQANFVERDCCENLDDVFRDVKPEAVIHLAAYAAEGLSHHIPRFNYTNNLVATANVLASAYRSGAKHFVFTSSIAVYGHAADESGIAEDAQCVPCDPYGIAKLACEQHIAAFHQYYGGPTYTIFRPHNVFGPKQNISDPFRNVAGIFFRCAKLGLPMPVFGQGNQTRSFSYIDVVARCIADSCQTPAARNEIFNIGSDDSRSVLALAQAIADAMSTELRTEFLPMRKEVLHAHANHDKAKRIFNDVYQNAVSFDQGLELMAQYVKSMQVPDPTPCPAPIEIDDQLPPKWISAIR